jgi:L-ascorbate metabolism protein UlaG (beta-lactamase superfamily)
MNRRSFFKKSLVLGAGLSLPAFADKGEESDGRILDVAKPDPAAWNDSELTISWLGHSTVLINFFGKTILTDPLLFDQIGLYIMGVTIGPARYTPPALRVEEVPKPHLILLSHAHMDHMDYRTLAAFTDRYPKQIDCVTAYNTEDVIRDLEWKSLKELDWKEQMMSNGIALKALEVKHFGWRYPWERDRSKGFFAEGRSYNAYVLEAGGVEILFGGDTAFTDTLKRSNEKVDIAIMPIGAYNPWRFNHCTPEEALQMADELNAKYFIPIHCNTIKQGLEPVTEPIQRLAAALPAFRITAGITGIGQTFTYA